MITVNPSADGRFYRDADRALLGGVCAGIANYLGFNLTVTRILMFIAFLATMPIAIVGYLAACFLIPAASYRDAMSVSERRIFGGRRRRRRRREAAVASEPPPPSARADIVRRKCTDLEARLAELEKQVTSRKFQIEQELSRL